MNLLNNEFNYQPMGLLDDTHIRFFTKPGIDALVTNSGYNIDKIDAVYWEPQNTEFGQKYSNFGLCLATSLFFRDYAHVYQFIYQIGLTSQSTENRLINFSIKNKIGFFIKYILKLI